VSDCKATARSDGDRYGCGDFAANEADVGGGLMAHIDLIRTNDGMPSLPDLSKLTAEEKVDALYRYIRSEQDYIVRLKEQIGYELKLNKKE
jgi:hypothetical protein